VAALELEVKEMLAQEILEVLHLTEVAEVALARLVLQTATVVMVQHLLYQALL
jgi:hypothetical protein